VQSLRAKIYGLSVGMLTAALSTAPAIAAEDEEEKSRQLEEVVVSATRRETDVMETPFAMQAFTGAQLEAENILDTRDLYDLVPGLLVTDENSRNDHTVHMRGSSITSVSADDGQSAVGYYVDDVPWVGVSSQVSPNIDYFDVKRVEVLRGPQGTSFGQDAMGGTFRVYTNDPDLNEPGYKVKVGYKSRSRAEENGYNAGFVGSFPVIENTLGIRVNYSRSYDPGHGSVDGRPDIDDPTAVTANNWRIKALWRINDAADVTFTHSSWDWETAFFTSTQTITNEGGKTVLRPLGNRATTARFTDNVPDNSATNEWTSLNLKWDLGFAEFTSSTSHAESIGFFNYDSGGPNVGILFDWPNNTDSHEFRLVSTTDSPFQWLAGAYWHDSFQKFSGIVDIDYTVENDGFNFQQTYVETTLRASEAWSLYGEVSYELNEQWVVLAGLRYKEDKRKLGNDRTNRDVANDPVEGNFGGHPKEFGTYTGTSTTDPFGFTYDNWNPRINVTYYPSDNGMFYLNAATGFRAPIFHRSEQKLNLERGGFTNFATNEGTEVDSIEVGTKWTLLDGRLTAQAAIAKADWEGVPIGVTFGIDDNGDGVDDRNASAPIPGGDVEIISYEWDFAFRATDQLSLSYAGAFIDGEIVEDASDVVTSFPTFLLAGNDIPNTAKWSHIISARYSAPLMDTGWNFFGSANWAHRSRPYAATAAASVPADDNWDSVSMTLAVSKGPYTIDFSATNLTDEDRAFTPGSSSATTNGVLPMPRTFQLQVTYDGFSM
jgi:iron complex outermembrane recepter protein